MLGQLVLAVVLMFMLFRLASSWRGGITSRSFANDPLAYHNEPFGFSLRVPDSTWKIIPQTIPDSLPREAAFGSLLETSATAVCLEKILGDTVSISAEVGVLKPNPPRASSALAEMSLQQIRSRHRANDDTVLVIAPTTPVTSKILDGAFFVVEIPTRVAVMPPRFTVWVVTYFTRGERVYVVTGKTRSADYNRLRDEVAFLVQEFRVL